MYLPWHLVEFENQKADIHCNENYVPMGGAGMFFLLEFQKRTDHNRDHVKMIEITDKNLRDRSRFHGPVGLTSITPIGVLSDNIFRLEQHSVMEVNPTGPWTHVIIDLVLVCV